MFKKNGFDKPRISIAAIVCGGIALAGGSVANLGSYVASNLTQSTRRSTDPPVPARGKLGQELFMAIGMQNTKAIEELLAQGADPNSRNGLEFSPLYIAAATHQTDVMKTLVKAGAKPDLASTYGTPLMFAAMTGNVDGFNYLLSLGVNDKVQRTDGSTPLMMATLSGAAPIVDILIQRKIDVDVQDNTGATALDLAARRGNVEIGAKLIEAGAKVDNADDYGQTPLMEAAIANHPDFIKLLLKHGAKVDAKDNSGRTALLLAANYGDYPEVVKTLKDAGSNTDAKDSSGHKAIDLAKSHGFAETVVALGGPAGISAPSRDAMAAVAKSVKLIQSSMISFAKTAKCVSCHHDGLGRIATAEARDHGFSIDSKLQTVQQPRLTGMLMGLKPLHEGAAQNPELMKQLPLVEMNEVTTGYSWVLGGMAAQKEPASEATGAMALILGRMQAPDGSWTFSLPREPMQSSFFAYTALSIRSLAAYGPKANAAEIADRIAKGKAWLLTAKATTSEDRANRLLGLKWAGATDEECKPAIAEILADQQADGGWRQLTGMASDAYATGQALYALHVAGVPTNSAEYRRGANFLLRTQDADGSWFVSKRCMPANNYTDGGFPHGESQYASFNGTCWATMALLPSIDGKH